MRGKVIAALLLPVVAVGIFHLTSSTIQKRKLESYKRETVENIAGLCSKLNITSPQITIKVINKEKEYSSIDVCNYYVTVCGNIDENISKQALYNVINTLTSAKEGYIPDYDNDRFYLRNDMKIFLNGSQYELYNYSGVLKKDGKDYYKTVPDPLPGVNNAGKKASYNSVKTTNDYQPKANHTYKENGPLDVNNYDDAEDFYDDNSDYFDDYDDAEMFYDDNHK